MIVYYDAILDSKTFDVVFNGTRDETMAWVEANKNDPDIHNCIVNAAPDFGFMSIEDYCRKTSIA